MSSKKLIQLKGNEGRLRCRRKEVETKTMTQRDKSLIASVKGGRMSKDDIERSFEAIFGKGSSKEIEEAATKERINERIE